MPLTHFPRGASSFGMPLLPGPGVVPNIPPSSGSFGNQGVYFVNGDYGNDGYAGTSPSYPKKTLDAAYNLCAGGANEIVYLIGGSKSVNLSASIASGGAGLVWSKNMTHLIGLCGPASSGQRAHFSNGASTNLYTPLIQVSGTGCYFSNIEIFNGGANATEAAVALLVTGDYNTFENCQISGGGNATSAADNSCRSLVITGNGTGGGGENTFRHCYIGLTTMQRGGTSTEVELKTNTPRNWFEDCTFATAASVTTVALVTVGAGGIQDFAVFRNCLFINPGTAQGASICAQALAINAAPGGVLMLHNCLSGGASVSFTKFQTTASGVVFGDNAGSAAGAYGIAMTS